MGYRVLRNLAPPWPPHREGEVIDDEETGAALVAAGLAEALPGPEREAEEPATPEPAPPPEPEPVPEPPPPTPSRRGRRSGHS